MDSVDWKYTAVGEVQTRWHSQYDEQDWIENAVRECLLTENYMVPFPFAIASDQLR